MAEKILSVFIDESGDFGPYDFHAPFYLVAMVLHNQDVDISKNIDDLERHLTKHWIQTACHPYGAADSQGIRLCQ